MPNYRRVKIEIEGFIASTESGDAAVLADIATKQGTIDTACSDFMAVLASAGATTVTGYRRTYPINEGQHIPASVSQQFTE